MKFYAEIVLDSIIGDCEHIFILTLLDQIHTVQPTFIGFTVFDQFLQRLLLLADPNDICIELQFLPETTGPLINRFLLPKIMLIQYKVDRQSNDCIFNIVILALLEETFQFAMIFIL